MDIEMLKDGTPEELACLGALRDFLQSTTNDHKVFVYAFKPSVIGGVRISEVSFARSTGGYSYMRSDRPGAEFILACENFLFTLGCTPVKPEGWTSWIDEDFESRYAILDAMGMSEMANKLYQERLVELNEEESQS